LPISQEEFEQGRIDLALPIAKILSDYPELAFTAVEVQQMVIERAARTASLNEVEQALEAMVSQGRLQKREIGGQHWYNVPRRRLGFLRGSG
jgi:hypothetical protein